MKIGRFSISKGTLFDNKKLISYFSVYPSDNNPDIPEMCEDLTFSLDELYKFAKKIVEIVEIEEKNSNE